MLHSKHYYSSCVERNIAQVFSQNDAFVVKIFIKFQGLMEHSGHERGKVLHYLLL